MAGATPNSRGAAGFHQNFQNVIETTDRQGVGALGQYDRLAGFQFMGTLGWPCLALY